MPDKMQAFTAAEEETYAIPLDMVKDRQKRHGAPYCYDIEILVSIC